MQMIALPTWAAIPLFACLWCFFQAGAAWFCFRVPDRYFVNDNWLYKTRFWEYHGRLYENVFRVRAWKGLLPDGGAWFRGGYQKRHLASFSQENLNRFLLESQAGGVHALAPILPFWIFGFFGPVRVVWMMLAYALAANLPCIIAQRYNRPRIALLLARIREKEGNSVGQCSII